MLDDTRPTTTTAPAAPAADPPARSRLPEVPGDEVLGLLHREARALIDGAKR